jgi:sulfite exporter TauE/SafE
MSGWLEAIAAAAFVAGLAGGAHCAAMCGSIVGAVSRVGAGAGARWRIALAYNAGRIASYGIAGLLAGALGQAGLMWRGGAAAQHLLLALGGAALIVLALYLAGIAPFMRAVESVGAAVWRRIQPWSRHLLPVDTVPRALGLGALWGWLPCGMVYAVLLTALAAGSAAGGALIMLAFGAGTLPNLLSFNLLFDRLARWRRLRPVRVAGSLLIGAFGAAGLFKAMLPHTYAADGLACRYAPGLSVLFQ